MDSGSADDFAHRLIRCPSAELSSAAENLENPPPRFAGRPTALRVARVRSNLPRHTHRCRVADLRAASEETAPWVGLLGPAKTPVAIVTALHDAMVKALAKPEVRLQLEKLGAVIVGDTPAEFATFLKRDYDRWEHVIKAAAIKPENN